LDKKIAIFDQSGSLLKTSMQ